MKFLIDGHAHRVQYCLGTWPDLVAGQLLTPLTGYRLGARTFAIDNGAYSKLNERRFKAILERDQLRWLVKLDTAAAKLGAPYPNRGGT